MRKPSLFFPLFTLIGTAGLVPLAAHADDRTLTVYTYESFIAEWGPGPKVKQAFEADCGCRLDWVGVADGVALLNRLKLEGDKAAAGVVLGLDTNLVTEAKATSLFAPHDIDTSAVSVPGGYADDVFVPYDYGHFAVVYDTQAIKTPPSSLKELVEGDPSQKIVIEDPRTSTPGLGLLLWVKAIYGDDSAAAWAMLRDRVLTVTPGWSEAYGLFTSGEAPMVLSYVTSPAYHMIAEDSDRYQAASFSEGQYLQIEVAGILKAAPEPDLARQFLAFMLTTGFQDTIATNNWMMPAAPTSEPLPEPFERLVKPTKDLLLPSDEVAAHRKAWVDEWQEAMSK
ncbi:thiamine transport system substrate-binding protein [Hoeflea marina]|uniref:Thiamine transport system substrate-binding protein n=1 Tax=Hoeflea marina TaxID=274592 RepID=A0A317PEJ4_9HYPH|nr:thiamine ABC transporter substrate binding subunit [Hoeflea marina]PWV98189.1 thiamine transport system substrate-binding protein [Hoeflea marina]